jgi:GDP-4-dehydro-6-deoxy-D-mannose reductase
MPDAVIHLAAQSFVADAFRDPEHTLQVNLMGTLHLLQTLQRARFGGRILFVGTGDVYGSVEDHALPVSERQLPAPRNPYAVSKLAAEALCRQWAYTEALDVVIARPFNHIGPGQSERFVVSDFARQVARIAAKGVDPVIHTGDIDVTRDFTDVRDVVRAYFSLLDCGRTAEVYNVCSGREVSIRALLERLGNLARVDISVRADPNRTRRAEQRRMWGDASKIRSATGWQPAIPLDDSLRDILDYSKNKVNG